jgi:hypothetical protein
MDGNNRELRWGRVYYRSRAWLSATMHGRDRATKHEHQAQGKKDFADDFCFHITYPMCLFCEFELFDPFIPNWQTYIPKKLSATSCALLFGGKGRHLLLPWLRSVLDDKSTFACVALLLLCVALLACWVPAR